MNEEQIVDEIVALWKDTEIVGKVLVFGGPLGNIRPMYMWTSFDDEGGVDQEQKTFSIDEWRYLPKHNTTMTIDAIRLTAQNRINKK